jgi:hypothetical protein
LVVTTRCWISAESGVIAGPPSICTDPVAWRFVIDVVTVTFVPSGAVSLDLLTNVDAVAIAVSEN